MKIAKDYFIILGVIASSFVIFMLRNKFGVIEKYEYMAVFIFKDDVLWISCAFQVSN